MARLSGDRGTMIPMIMLCFLLAATFGCASIAASAAFLAQRDLAGACDGAAVAAANAVSRADLGTTPAGLRRPPEGEPDEAVAAAGPNRGSTTRPGDPVATAWSAVAWGDRPLWTAASGPSTSGAGDRSAGAPFGRGDTVGRDGPNGGGGSGPAAGARAADDAADRAGKSYYVGDPGVADGDVLPLDPDAVARVVAEYQATAAVGGSPIRMTAGTDGQEVTVTCRRTVRVPFGQLLGYGDGLERTAIAQARSPLD